MTHDATPDEAADLPSLPTDWGRALVLVAHPDDAEYGMSAAVARWTDEGKVVEYVLGTSGEAGIEGMPAQTCGPLREGEQRRAAAAVGVSRVDFLGFPDGRLTDDEQLRAALARVIAERRPDVVLGIFSGDEWAPGAPNQRDHMEFGRAVAAAVESSSPRPLLFENGGAPTHTVDVTAAQIERAVRSLAEHREYLCVLDPHTPAPEQAAHQVKSVLGDPPRVGFAAIEPTR